MCDDAPNPVCVLTYISQSGNETVEGTRVVAGGGTVYFPAGTYLCYSIRLKSNVALYLDQGATILAAPNPLEQLQVPTPVVLHRSRLKRKPSPA